MSISFKDQVAMVTGAGNGLGRSHALALAAMVVGLNSLFTTPNGGGFYAIH